MDPWEKWFQMRIRGYLVRQLFHRSGAGPVLGLILGLLILYALFLAVFWWKHR